MNPRRQATGASLEEIERIYRARLPEFRRVAAAIGGDRDLARDSVQEAFARAVRERAAFRRQGSLEGWLWRIVVNTTRSQRRASRPTAPLTEAEAPPANGRPEADTEAVRAALAALPERQRAVLFLHYYADLGYETIAQALDISAGTVGATLHAARSSLRRLLEEEVTR